MDMNDYCIVGAGPGGLQMGYFMKQNGWNYKMFEKESTPDNEDLLFTKYSNDYFPHADSMLTYLNDYAMMNDLNIMYNTEIEKVSYDKMNDKCRFKLQIMGAMKQCCKTLVMASGMSQLKHLNISGNEHLDSYDKMSTNPKDYEGKSVLIIGKGNSAFEIASSIYGVTNYVHLVSRNRLRMSWETHYTGDLRGVSNEVLDAYQLKSLDTVLEADASKFTVTKGADGMLHVTSSEGNLTTRDSSPMRQGYDKVIECVGFQWDDSVFEGGHPSTMYPEHTYPVIKTDFESEQYPGLYFAGNLAHSLDYRKSSGGFIHGFRYTAKALSKILARKNEDKSWPSMDYKMDKLTNHLLTRASESSAIYQMYGYLCDVAVLDKDSNMFKYYEEFPIKNLKDFAYYAKMDKTEEMKPSIVLCKDYGRNFSGPGMDVFGPSRSVTSPDEAANSKYLHPWIYLFNNVPKCLKEATYVHHVLEDSTYTFDGPMSHVKPFEMVLDKFLSGVKLHMMKSEL
uniref:Uncharacterized protein n=1 Tax=Acrobeloides nanus TaxID=290746 RepID=A0A914DVJ9_9BILA